MSTTMQLNRDVMKLMKESDLGPVEKDLIERALIEALRNGSDCEIEQIVSMPKKRSRLRLRVQVTIAYSPSGELDQLRLALQKGGEPVLDWAWSNAQASRPDDSAWPHPVPYDTEVVDSVTAIILFSATIDRYAKTTPSKDNITSCCAGIASNARRILRRNAIEAAA